MNILLLSTEDFLGAGKAALRIQESLAKAGHETALLVKNKLTRNNPHVFGYHELVKPGFIGNIISKTFNKLLNLKPEIFDTDKEYYFFGNRKFRLNISYLVKKLPIKPDIILTTWTSGFLNHELLLELKQLTGAKLFLYPLDMSLFTGGCHYAWNCEGYTLTCEDCPAILQAKNKDWAKKELAGKKKSYRQSEVHWLAASAGLKQQLLKSAVAENKNGISELLLPVNEEVFNNRNRENAKVYFGISKGKKTIFFGASFTHERRKGVHYFIEIMKHIYKNLGNVPLQADDILLLIAGNKSDHELIEQMPFATHHLGYLHNDEDLSLAYQASDVFVSTSLQDGGPMMINEAVMCGTPVVCFRIGVSENLVLDGVSGYKAEIGDIGKMVDGILQILALGENEFSLLSGQTAKLGQEATGYKQFSKRFAAITAALT